VTKVLNAPRSLGFAAAIAGTATLLFSCAIASETNASHPAEDLYLQLGRVGLDPARVYQVREALIERPGILISLEDGRIAFTQDVMGHVTGAFFEGEGDVLVVPPNEVERRSMSLFTGMAILEERFVTAYFRFNDDTMGELRPDLRAADSGQEFVRQWNETAKNLAHWDAMRLLVTLSRYLPEAGTGSPPSPKKDAGDRMLHARLQGTKLGVFDVFVDSTAAEQVQIGQARVAENGDTYYDVWTSFVPVVGGPASLEPGQFLRPEGGMREALVAIRRYVINTEVKPPKHIHAEARLQLHVRSKAPRALLFELSRFLQVESVEMNGQAVEFIHNPAVEGTQLSRRGNDIIAVILPQLPRDEQEIELRFVYGGEVLAEAGSGLLYVGERGTWYPNRGLAMADFDLTFRYPQGWTLVATGKPTAANASYVNNETEARWISERPIPVAGFNLGKYKIATAQAGNVTVETYATLGVEKDFPSPPIQVIEPSPRDPASTQRTPQIVAPQNPSPARTQLSVAEAAAGAIQFFSERLGPFPYSRLALTQMPGRESQGWPSLIFLSSYAFLTDAEREQMHFDLPRRVLQQQIPAHETAHQWWGDLISWRSYRDQWLSEGLANYCALMMVQQKNPVAFREIMQRYRLDLVRKNKDGASPEDAGPVTLGVRLLSSHFPEGYEEISYGRGTWLFHMLRTMMQDTASADASRRGRSGSSSEEPFMRALRKVRQRYEGKSISTSELLEVFAEELPQSLRYEGKRSLDWFLTGWVNGTALPRLELRSVKFLQKGGNTVVSGTILQRDAPADLVTSVPVYLVSAGKPTLLLGRVFADGEESTFHLSASVAVHKIVLDPYETILTAPK
jgi:hypothetical protein